MGGTSTAKDNSGGKVETIEQPAEFDKTVDANTNNATVMVVMEQLKSKEEIIIALDERLKSGADSLTEEKEKSKNLRQEKNFKCSSKTKA